MVEVVRIRGNRITLGLVAPEDVKIVRGELKKLPAKSEGENAGEHFLKSC